MNPTPTPEQFISTNLSIQQFFELFGIAVPMLLVVLVGPMAIWLVFYLGDSVLQQVKEILANQYPHLSDKPKHGDKPKTGAVFDPFGDDESPTYMTIGDDGELVEVEHD